MPQVNNVWGQAASAQFLELPSGQTCYAQKMGVEEVMTAGLYGELDLMTSFVVNDKLQGHNKPQKQIEQEKINEVVSNPQLFSKLIMLMDKIIPQIIVEPKVHLHFEQLADSTRMLSEEDRKKINLEAGVEYIYTDKIPTEDKMFLFQWASGGVDDPITFRKELQSSMDSVADGQAVQRPSQRPPRRRRR